MNITDQMFVKIVETDNNSVVITDNAGIIQYVNKRFLDISGYTKEECIGKHTRILKSGYSSDDYYKNLWETITVGKIWTGEFYNKKKNGVFYWEKATISPIYDDDNSIIGFVAIKTEITEEKKLIEQLNDRNKFIEQIASTNPNVIYIYDLLYNKEIYVNAQIQNLVGYTPKEILDLENESFKIIVHTDDQEKLLNYYESIKNQTNGKIYEVEYKVVHKNGSIRWVFRRDIIYEFESGVPKLIVGTVIDITERKLYEEKLIESNITKDKLFSIVSHDLRSPFNSLVGYIELLHSEINNLSKEDIQNFSYNIFSISKQINILLTNLLDWSLLNTDKISPNCIKINLFDFVNYTFDTLRLLSVSKDIELINNINKNINVYVDEKMIYSILYNLIYNSIKFTHVKGHVIVSAANGNFISKDRICISVSDNGIGMTYENMGKLFILAGQYTTYGTNKESGSGLGLIIVKEFVEKMGGKIEVKSDVNKGTEFIFDVELY